jgi:FAD/FMN-containing dehydrogenase
LQNLPIAIKGGGHNAAGASSVEDGLVIDLSRYFNRVRVDPESKRAYVGGGSIWETVDKEAIKYGLATVAGLLMTCVDRKLISILIDDLSMI